MKLLITASGPSLDGPVNMRFGRCSHFVVFDTESESSEVLENAGAMSGSGAGVQAAQRVAQSGVQAVLTGNVGPNAFQVLNAAGVAVYQAGGMTVRAAIEAFEAGELSAVSGPTNAAHTGMR